MAQKSINKLTNEELNLICSTDYPMLKKSAMGKIKDILHLVGIEISNEINTKLPEYKGHYKISTGENFDNCPFLVLDIPQINPKNFGFVFRIFFRWGNHFSLQCILNKSKFDANLVFSKLSQLDGEILFLSGNNPWENRHENINYQKIKELGLNQIEFQIQNEEWIKFCTEFSIKKPECLYDEAIGFYKNIIRILELTAQKSF